ncbi:pheromone receptor Rcb2 B44 [Mycena floridula]|nr:pheromone receptor Rcb2 B44 [Mycena floridula]
MTTDPTYPLFPIFAFLGFILPLIPLSWHFQAWNSGTCYYMIWASLACLNQFVNSIVWAGNAINHAPIWCDISIRIMMGASVGLPAASLCINRRLYQIACVQTVSVTRKEKLHAVLIDTGLCVVFPMVFVAAQYIVQGHRFNIYEDFGCYPALYNTIPMYFISSIWPIIIGLVSACYCVLSLLSLSRRRAAFSEFLSSNKGMSVSRYFRLMALAVTDIVFTVPLAIFTVWLNVTAEPIGPWRSWADTHFAYSRVEQFPSILYRRNHLLVVALELTRWVNPLCAIVFFVYFGFAQEARRHYRLAFWAIAKRFGQYKPPTSFVKPLSSPTLPLYDIKRPVSIATSFTKSFDVKLLSYDSSSQHPLRHGSVSSTAGASSLRHSDFSTTQYDEQSRHDRQSYHYDLESDARSSVSSHSPRAI